MLRKLNIVNSMCKAFLIISIKTVYIPKVIELIMHLYKHNYYIVATPFDLLLVNKAHLPH